MKFAKQYGLTCLGLLLIGCGIDPMNMKRTLPPSASDVHEVYCGAGIDYARYMKAKIDKNDYVSYATTLGYTSIVTSATYEELKRCRLHPNLRWQEEGENVWWDLHDTGLLGSFYKVDMAKESYSIMKYSNGYLYYKFMKM